MTSLNDVLLAMSNIPVDDPIAEIWGRGLQGGHEIIEYTGTLPISITADGNALLDYRIYGNTVQDGTPTPENPVDVVGCGVRTENLFDEATAEDTMYYINDGGGRAPGINGDRFIAQQIGVKPLTEYTFSWRDTIKGTADNSPYIRISKYANTQFLGREIFLCIDYINRTFTIETDQYTTVLDIRYDSSTSSRQQTITNLMINEGGTALLYEPYGYKLPILSNSAVTNIYLGEVETTRRIKKLVLTGEEDWIISTTWKRASTSVFYFILWDIFNVGNTDVLALSDRFEASTRYGLYDGDSDMIARTGTNSLTIRISDSIATTDTDFKAYLAAQYAAGTPVTVWYVLAEPETDIVNEPLMKIGDYADTISMEQAGASIPTFAGTTVIDYDGAPKPSEMYIKYRR